MRCVMSVTGMGEPAVRTLPDEIVASEPHGSVVLAWEQGEDRVRLVVTPEQLSALCDQVIEWVTTTREASNGEDPSNN